MASEYYPPPGFYFRLAFSGVSNKDDIQFQEASGIQAEISTTEELSIGGENRFSYKLPGKPKYSNLVLKRGLARVNSQLAKWVRTTLSNGFEAKVEVKTITLSLLKADGQPLTSWIFYNAYPVKVQISDLKSMENALVIETLEMAYTYFDSNK